MNQAGSELVPLEERASDQLSLHELAARANREHSQAQTAAAAAILHAIRSGEALAVAKEKVAPGQWEAWLESNFTQPGMARYYMRLAVYRDALLPKLDELSGVAPALKYLRGLPAADGSGGAQSHDPAVVREAHRLRSEGLSQRDIADVLEVAKSCVGRWLLGEAKRKSKPRQERIALRRRARREKAARAALRRQEQERAVKRHGGKPAEVYSLVRKALQEADQVVGETSKPEVRSGFNAVLAELARAEDHIIEALRIEA